MASIKIIKGDITTVNFDVIVNAANPLLMKGGGVCGAIHNAAGNELEKECLELDRCSVGQAKLTKSYDLAEAGISWVIHAVGPKWQDGTENEDVLLLDAYENSIKAAVNYKEMYMNQCLEVLEKYLVGVDEAQKEIYKKDVQDNIMEYIENHPIRSIAFPSISTGIYRFPIEKASKIAVDTVIRCLNDAPEIETVAFVCVDDETYEAFKNAIYEKLKL